MLKVQNQKWMIWVIVFLLLMNAATIITVIYINRDRAGYGKYDSRMPVSSEKSSLRYSGRYFHEKLGFDMEQMRQFMKVNPGFRMRARLISQEIDREKQALLKEIAGDKCDTLRMNMISDSIGMQHSKLKKLTCKYYLDLRCICKESQRDTLNAMFSEMFRGEASAIQYGRGQQNSKGHGRQFNN